MNQSPPTPSPENPGSPKPLPIGPVLVDPPILQAPMAGFTNFAFRQLVRRFGGVGLPATEMVSARGLLEMHAREDREPERLWGVRDEARPLAVQIWDNDPDTLAEVGRRLVEDYAVSVVDINFGCPVRAVSEKAQSGSYLLREPDRIGELVHRVVQACRPVPVTAKIRLGPDERHITSIDVAQAIEGAGGAAVTVHGRTARQMYSGRADWQQISAIRPHLKHIPLIGNGDLTTADDVVDALDRWDVDGVMIGRAGLGRPWLFSQAHAALQGLPVPPDPSLDAQRQLLLDHFALIVARFGPTKGTILMRAYACCYAASRPGVRRFRSYLSTAATPEAFTAAVQAHFPRDEVR
ncbi:MAG: tRNA-dihydrouridine synthase [Pirellulales bacterium]|nr:tRNA-dihydrouridine synthase [Pirellulales bacterium]